MNLSFRFVLEKSVLHFKRAAGHAPIASTRPDRQPAPVDPTGFHLCGCCLFIEHCTA